MSGEEIGTMRGGETEFEETGSIHGKEPGSKEAIGIMRGRREVSWNMRGRRVIGWEITGASRETGRLEDSLGRYEVRIIPMKQENAKVEGE